MDGARQEGWGGGGGGGVQEGAGEKKGDEVLGEVREGENGDIRQMRLGRRTPEERASMQHVTRGLVSGSKSVLERVTFEISKKF